MLTLGLLKEILPEEHRVLLAPEGVKQLIRQGLKVLVEDGAGVGAGFETADYEKVGATILPSVEKVVRQAEVILKIMPPKPIEYELFNENHRILSFLNLKFAPDRLKDLLATKATYFSLELLQEANGIYPVLMAMSEISGQIAVHMAAHLLMSFNGGKGKTLNGWGSVKPASILILGGGKVARTAALEAVKAGAKVTMLGMKPGKLTTFLEENTTIQYFPYSPEMAKTLLPETDVLISAVYSLWDDYPVMITRDMVNLMSKGSVVIDVSVNRSKTIESSAATTHEQPVYQLDGITYYCVPNLPAAVPFTATRVLSKTVMPYIRSISRKSLKSALIEQPGLLSALSLYRGKITNRFLADYHKHEFYNIFELLELNL